MENKVQRIISALKDRGVFWIFSLPGLFIICISAMAVYGSIVISLEMQWRQDYVRYVMRRDEEWENEVQEFKFRIEKQDKVFNDIINDIREIKDSLSQKEKH